MLHAMGKPRTLIDAYRPLRGLMERFGVAKVWILGEWCVIISRAEDARLIYSKPELFPKRILSDMLPNSFWARYLGRSILYSNGQEWKRHRKVTNPAFVGKWPTEVFGECAIQLIHAIEREIFHPKDIHCLMQRLTLDALGKIGFGFNFNALLDPEGPYVTLYDKLTQAMEKITYMYIPPLDTPSNPFRKPDFENVEAFEQLLLEVVKKRMREFKTTGESKENKDILSSMISASMEENDSNFSERDLLENLKVFFLAGHDTTANSLACVMYYLAKYPEAQAKAREQVLELLGDSHYQAPTYEQQEKMTYLTQVIKEVLRLCPSVAYLPDRYTKETTTFGDFTIPPNIPVIVHIYGIHRNPAYWTNPDEFDPSRFEEGKVITPGTWMPFGGGVRQCVGMSFSMVEQRVVLSMLLRHFEWTLPEDSIHKDGLIASQKATLVSAVDLGIIFTEREQRKVNPRR
ncbi:cytochrome P450 [Basidiobolus meristosporus CBS 931.73]|uniref:Cytochrome P450 n=1 Tax=Basidiobolus meristosporus CBS 931.73 TaxID=1314790 RepID=A0A1Y1X6I6_9FUNG|nr:cytochrome P450 [Basidiobolus meristosporus CBS 931.73]|eukprot:ORX81411.1 cytochrome P450 [Basidiobolus meristosporus CBS 931.73]